MILLWCKKPITYKAKGFFRKTGKRNNPQLKSAALQHPSVLIRAEKVLISVHRNLATNHRGNDVSKCGGDWTARHMRNGDPKPLLARARNTQNLVRSSIRAISTRPAEPFDREVERLDVEEGVQEVTSRNGDH